MAKWANDSVLDALLAKVATGTILTVCSAQPATRTQAITTYKLADTVIDSGDFTLGDGVTNGRKVIIAQQDNLDVDATNTATHVAVCDGSSLLYVTTLTSPQVLTIGNKVTVPAWNVEVSDPA